MDLLKIKEKFGDEFFADSNTYKMGIDKRITSVISERFINRNVLETCTGAGFTTIALAEKANSVITFEINKLHQAQAVKNVEKALLSEKVEFILGDILDKKFENKFSKIDAAFLDPDWADTNPPHKYKFINSTTKPPADLLLIYISNYTENITLILPPYIEKKEFNNLPVHEFQNIYFDGTLVLFCIYFGELIETEGETELHISSNKKPSHNK